MAARSDVDVLDYTAEALGRLRRGEDGLYSIETVVLRPSIVISSGSRLDRAQRLIEKAEEVCLIGRSIRSEVILEAEIMQALPVGS
jgi:organic hydroperoxide reductase OsmC/OhrA